MADQRISRAEAKRRGLMFYFTGKACPGGHISPRYVSSYVCRDCVTPGTGRPPGRTHSERLVYMRQWNVEHREEQREKKRRYYLEHKDQWPTYDEQGPERVKARVLAWQKANPDKVAAKQKRYRERRKLRALMMRISP